MNVELNNTFASHVGWVVPFGSEIVLVLPDEAPLAEAMAQLLRIG